MSRREPLVPVNRRGFLQSAGAAALGFAVPSRLLLAAPNRGAKALQGIFPIAQSPFTDAGALDVDSLVEEVRFIDRGRVHGFVWPQMASEWQTLTEAERIEGAEAIVATGKPLRPAIVIGVQGPDLATAVRYAKHAEKLGADAVISLPPAGSRDAKETLDYYKEIGRVTELPLFVQSTGSMSVESLVNIRNAVPTMSFVKDEAGDPLSRILPLREKSADRIKVFSGAHGRTLIEEMRRGSSGSMPAASFADLYAATWDLWHDGRRKEAMEMHARTLLVLTDMTNYGFEAMKYILCLRGVFKTYGVRQKAGGTKPAAGPGTLAKPTFDEAAQQSLRETLEVVKPYLRG